MKLLVVTAFNPFSPQTGSSIIVYNNIKEISKKHSVYLICLGAAEESGDFSGFVEKIEFVIPDKRPRFMLLLRCIFYVWFMIPIGITSCASRKMQRRVRELIESNKFDAILLYPISAIQYCPSASYQQVLVHVEDPPSIKENRMSRLPVLSLWKRFQWFFDARLMARYENRFLPKMAKVLLLSDADKRDMQEQAGYDNLGCVSYGVSKRTSTEMMSCEERAGGMIVFSGNMFHPPNIDGALFFLQDIFPLILQEDPAVTLWIVGAEPDSRIHDAAACFGEHVVITGRVKDMSEYLRRAKVSICPVRLRIGVQTKILEALSWGTPVVTTSAGNSGIGGRSGSELWVADEPNMFAHRVVALLRSEGWQQLSVEGRKFAQERFSWERSARELEEHIVSIQK